MGKSLYRSYRSKSFDEIVGQEHITRILQNSLKNNAVSHAYILSGPRGVGKTSVARILAYAVNKQEYGLESSNLDIIEIDAASNRRIDEIREIRDKVNIAPSVGKYKVYIIDEVHMLTREAFNALLKTLEEPPEHAIFILATTETQKVPETIISRCIRLNFRPIEKSVIADHLKMIAKKEKIVISDEAIDLIAEHGRGSFRDSISLLDQVKFSSENIGLSEVAEMLGLAPKERIEKIVGSLKSGDINSLSKYIQEAFESGSDPTTLTSQIQDYIRQDLINNNIGNFTPYQILSLQSELLSVPGSSKPRLALELTLSKYAIGDNSNEKVNRAPSEIPKVFKENVNISKQNKERASVKAVQKKQEKSSKIITKTNNADAEPIDNDVWSAFLAELKKVNNTLYGIGRMADFTIQDNVAHLKFRFAFHMKQVNEPKNKAIFSEILQKVTGKPIKLECSVVSGRSTAPNKEFTDELTNVSNIFGGHEVLES